MKRLIFKVHLKWKEPKLVCKAKDALEQRALSPWFKLGVAVSLAAPFMLHWWLVKQNPNKPPAFSALIVSMAGGALVTYGISWIYRRCPSSVQVFEHGIAQTQRNYAFWKFKEIDHCEIATITIGNTSHSVLVIHTLKARRIILGLPLELVPRLIQVLSTMNVQVEERVHETLDEAPSFD